MVFFVTAFHNLGPSELADSKLGKPNSTIPSGKLLYLSAESSAWCSVMTWGG